jgi:hypothetical protein
MPGDEEDDTPISRLAAVEMRDASLGNEVAKDFGEHGVFHGEVAEYDREGGGGAEEHYRVDWEDGDEEDLSPLEYIEARELWLELESDKRAGQPKKKRPSSKVPFSPPPPSSL